MLFTPDLQMRVGFVFYPPTSEAQAGWLGGVSYYRNLFRALEMFPARIEPVVVLPAAGGDLPSAFPSVEVFRTRLLDRLSLPWAARMSIRELAGSDMLLARALRHRRIEVLSHSAPLGSRASIPVVTWIPDFQHSRLPQFFTSATCRERDRTFANYATRSSLVVLSSESARRDFVAFAPRAAHKARVLRFADCSANEALASDLMALQARYQLPSKFLLLPNQFWAHKNHRTVLQALGLLKRSGRELLVLATGNTKDDRNPAFFEELMRERSAHGVEANFRALGIVPFADLAGLMRHAVAVINPSLFEGWSTTVEESKSLGKLLVLSAIDVHREQDPARALFFEPQDAEQLAERLAEAWESYCPEREGDYMREASAHMVTRRREFAEAYSAIAHEAAGAALG